MKFCRKFIYIVLVGFLSTSNAFCDEQNNSKSQRSLTPLANDIYLYRDKFHNGIVQVSDEGILLVDPLNAEAASWLRDEISKRFNKVVNTIVYTHHHDDHISGAEVFNDTVKEIIAHENVVPHLQDAGWSKTLPTRTFKEKLVLKSADKKVELIYLGPEGHTDNSIAVRFPDEGILFVVDIVGVDRTPHRYIGSNKLENVNDIDPLIDTLDRVEAMDFDMLVPGHLEPGSVSDVRVTRNYLLELRKQVLTLISAGLTKTEILDKVDMSAFRYLQFYDSNLPANIEAMHYWLLKQSTHDREIAFAVLGKKNHYRQDASGKLHFLNYFFFTNIVPAKGHTIKRAWFIPPGKTQTAYPATSGRRTFYGTGFGSRKWLDLAYPAGNYQIQIETPGNNQYNVSLYLADEDFGEAPLITLKQDGKKIAVDRVDPDKDLVFSWSPFSSGKKDPRKILDDLILIGIYSCRNETVAFLGRPNDGKNIIRFNDTEHSLAKGKLEAGQSYAMFLEHARLTDTGKQHGFLRIAAIAPQTYLDFKTTGKTVAGRECPTQLPRFEPGQTDRLPLQ
jgi:glyoxylase-like metal-dependent hydrolase (beta-lactamase superfamily II)